jgi:hypothetical protein
LDPSVQILEIALEVFLVVSPRQSVYAGRRVPSKFRERIPELDNFLSSDPGDFLG